MGRIALHPSCFEDGGKPVISLQVSFLAAALDPQVAAAAAQGCMQLLMEEVETDGAVLSHTSGDKTFGKPLIVCSPAQCPDGEVPP